MKIIAFGHRRRVGKDTAVKFALIHLKSHGVKEACRLSFFAPVKHLAYKLYEWGGLHDEVYYENHPELKEQVLPPIGKSPRDIWIDLGASLHQICPWTVCEMAFQKIPEGTYLIPDMRRPIEAEYVEKFGGYRVKIINPRIPEYDDWADSAMKDYEGWTHTIINDGSLKDYVGKINKLMRELTGVG